MALVLAFGQFIKVQQSPFVNVHSTDFVTHHPKPDIHLLGDCRYPDRHGHLTIPHLLIYCLLARMLSLWCLIKHHLLLNRPFLLNFIFINTITKELVK